MNKNQEIPNLFAVLDYFNSHSQTKLTDEQLLALYHGVVGNQESQADRVQESPTFLFWKTLDFPHFVLTVRGTKVTPDDSAFIGSKLTEYVQSITPVRLLPISSYEALRTGYTIYTLTKQQVMEPIGKVLPQDVLDLDELQQLIKHNTHRQSSQKPSNSTTSLTYFRVYWNNKMAFLVRANNPADVASYINAIEIQIAMKHGLPIPYSINPTPLTQVDIKGYPNPQFLKDFSSVTETFVLTTVAEDAKFVG